MVHVKLSEEKFISRTCLSLTQGRAQSFKVSVSPKQTRLKTTGQTTNMSKWILASIYWTSFIIQQDSKTESCCIDTICSSAPWKQGCELHVLPIFASVTSFSLPGQTCVYSQCALPGWFEHRHFHCHMQHICTLSEGRCHSSHRRCQQPFCGREGFQTHRQQYWGPSTSYSLPALSPSGRLQLKLVHVQNNNAIGSNRHLPESSTRQTCCQSK